jgi:hypothetical protein
MINRKRQSENQKPYGEGGFASFLLRAGAAGKSSEESNIKDENR